MLSECLEIIPETSFVDDIIMNNLHFEEKKGKQNNKL